MCYRHISSSRHFVCVLCHRSHKKRVEWGEEPRKHACPRCGANLIDAGHDLAVPKKTDVSGWRALTALLNAGVTFHSSCCEGPGWRPRTPREVRERLDFAAERRVPPAKALTTPDLDAARERTDRRGRTRSRRPMV
jgi:predicted RNA-binding Zn-ribbon protein involved in translation (DUF1610 family)